MSRLTWNYKIQICCENQGHTLVSLLNFGGRYLVLGMTPSILAAWRSSLVFLIASSVSCSFLLIMSMYSDSSLNSSLYLSEFNREILRSLEDEMIVMIQDSIFYLFSFITFSSLADRIFCSSTSCSFRAVCCLSFSLCSSTCLSSSLYWAFTKLSSSCIFCVFDFQSSSSTLNLET